MLSQSIEQGSEAWHEMRRNRIGASDASVIMEVSPYKTPYQLFEEKLFGKHTMRNSAMQRGIDMEPKARQEYEAMTGLFVMPQVIIDSRDWLMASLDGIDVEGKNAVEIKCAGSIDHNLALSGKVPTKYFPQLQHQIEVCQLEGIDYFSFDGEKGVVIKVFRNDEFIQEMLKKEYEFWERMQELNPPPLSDRDYMRKDDLEWSHQAGQYYNAKQNIKYWEQKEKECKQELIRMAEDKNCSGMGIRVSKIIRKGNIDYSKIEALEELDLEQYRKKPTIYWSITENG